MSAFNPTQTTLDPPRPDNLSAAVLHSLSRPIYGHVAWGPLRSFFFGAISFGVIPLIAWPRQFGRFVVAEQQQLWHLVEWLRVRTGDEDATKLRDSVRHTGAVPSLWIVPTILLCIVAANFLPMLTSPGFRFDHLFSATYGAAPWPMHHLVYDSRLFTWRGLFKVWTFCLCLGYLSHWLHVRQHVASVNNLLAQLNTILARQRLPQVPLFGVGIGLRPFWLLAGIIGLSCGAVWAIPAAFAGAIHQRYVRRTSTRIRGELAMRVSAALATQRPAMMNVPMPHGFRAVCRNPLCGKTLPSGSSFCSRCGSRVPAVDAVA